MIKKYGILGFSCLALLAIGCGDSSSATNSPSETTIQQYPAEIDEQAKTITLTHPTCEQISETEVRFNPEGKEIWEYELSGNSLDLYDGNTSMEYRGNNSSLYGTWTTAETKCEAYGLCANVEISSTSVTISPDMSGVCAFDYIVASFFSEVTDQGEKIIPSNNKTNCNSGTVDIAGETVSIKISKLNDTGIEMTAAVGDQECQLNMNDKPLTASLCTIENLDYIDDDKVYESNMEEFMECYLDLLMRVTILL